MINTRKFTRFTGRDMFTECLYVFSNKYNMPDKLYEKEFEDDCGLLVGDTIKVEAFGNMKDAELKIIKIKNDGYSGLLIMTVVNSNNCDWLIKHPEQKLKYGISLLGYATLVTPVDQTIVIPEYKEPSNIPKYVLRVERFTRTSKDWKRDMFVEDGINIGITVFENGIMSDQDVLCELPELEELDLGEIQMDDNGFVGITSYLSLLEIKKKLKDAGFNLM
jgi:hypothetical protein